MAKKKFRLPICVDSKPITAKLDQILTQLNTLGAKMSALSEAVAAAAARVHDDFEHIKSTLDQALARLAELGGAADEIDRLRAEGEAARADIASAVEELAKLDPDPDYSSPPPVDPNDVPHPDQTLPGDLPPDAPQRGR